MNPHPSPPPEWAPVRRIYTALPWDRREWGEALAVARAEVAAFARAVAAAGTPVTILTPASTPGATGNAVDISPADALPARYGDIWLRDTGPIFAGETAHAFAFNGWGGKYVMAGDEKAPQALAADAGRPLACHAMILEGGAIDHDGAGTAITTEQCLLDPNRNPDMTKADNEAVLARTLGFTRIIWLGDGLVNDHTDGHVDNLARFVAPGTVAVPEAADAVDPNDAAYEDAARRVLAAGLTLVRLPSPGCVTADDGAVMPASYANFSLSNELVVVPQFGVPNDVAAVEALGTLFPTRRAVGLPARHILAGGGAFHCMTRELPR